MTGWNALDLLLVALAAWYTAESITSKDGPFGAFRRLREAVPLGGLTTCIYCVMPYTAAAFVGVHIIAPPVTWAFAATGAALMLRSYTGVRHDV